jgi:hypothetical protein
MKLLSLQRNWPDDRMDLLNFLLAPSLSLPSWRNRRIVLQKDIYKIAVKGFVYTILLGLVFYFELTIPTDLSPWLQGYLAVIPFWLMLEAVQTLLQILWLPTGRLVPQINVYPFLSRSVVEFWGKRWNMLFGDWLYEICFRKFSRNPNIGIFFAFLISSLLHELLVSVPYLLVYKESLFGLMTAYFGIQAVAVIVQRVIGLTSLITKRVFCWVVVVGPAPMVLNPGTLGIFHLTSC